VTGNLSLSTSLRSFSSSLSLLLAHDVWLLVSVSVCCNASNSPRVIKDNTEMTSPNNHDGAAAAPRCNPLTWSELQTIISAGDLHKLARSEEQEQTYCKARSKVRLIFLCSMKHLPRPHFQLYHLIAHHFVKTFNTTWTIYTSSIIITAKIDQG